METKIQKYSGVLLHPTSFPSPYGIGDLGQGAYDFIDYLAGAGQTIWQTLPLGPTGFGDSPYQSFSAFAGQPLLISPDKLIEEGLLTKEDCHYEDVYPAQVDYGNVIIAKTHWLHTAFYNFNHGSFPVLEADFQDFCKTQDFWLSDYAEFMAYKDSQQGRNWLEWDKVLPVPDKDQIHYYCFIQFLFFRQWKALKTYANEKGIQIVGDIPIFLALDSADVWADKNLFQLDSYGYPTKVAGVPPDYFSATGQLWGNPLYDWKAHKKEDFRWWLSRIKHQLSLFDILRIDHFRGLESYWAVPYGEATAINGTWMPGPGADLFKAIEKEFPQGIPIWAEDLGVITPEVENLRDTFHLPGMKVLQFAFEDLEDNDMMPEHHPVNAICYPGTHDNNTAIGWYQSASRESQQKVRDYMHTGAAAIHWAFIKTAMNSNCKYTVIPMQDILGLDSSARMNIPGVAARNWSWRYTSGQLDSFWQKYLCRLTADSGRYVNPNT